MIQSERGICVNAGHQNCRILIKLGLESALSEMNVQESGKHPADYVFHRAQSCFIRIISLRTSISHLSISE
jgi:hypothetical protein